MENEKEAITRKATAIFSRSYKRPNVTAYNLPQKSLAAPISLISLIIIGAHKRVYLHTHSLCIILKGGLFYFAQMVFGPACLDITTQSLPIDQQLYCTQLPAPPPPHSVIFASWISLKIMLLQRSSTLWLIEFYLVRIESLLPPPSVNNTREST